MFLIAYDIASPRRLARVARRIEKQCERIQKSVFLAELSRSEMKRLFDDLERLTMRQKDVIQAWKIKNRSDGPDFGIGTTRQHRVAALVQSGNTYYLLDHNEVS